VQPSKKYPITTRDPLDLYIKIKFVQPSKKYPIFQKYPLDLCIKIKKSKKVQKGGHYVSATHSASSFYDTKINKKIIFVNSKSR
jgi:hypothetical protein